MKHDNLTNRILKIIELLDSGSCNRKSLSVALGISLSSVGSTVSHMLSLGIIGEYSKKSDITGQKSGVLYLNKESVFAVADISSKEITTHLFGHGLSINESFVHKIDDPLFIDDCFFSYFRKMSRRRPNILGVCLLCNGYPCSGKFIGSGICGLDNLPLREIALEHLGNITVLLENRSLYALPGTDELSVIISDTGSAVHTDIILNGRIVSSRNPSAIGFSNVEAFDKRSFSSRIKYAVSFDEYTSAVADLIECILSLVDAKNIVFHTDRYHNNDAVINGIYEKLALLHSCHIAELPPILSVHPNDISQSKYILQNLRFCHLKNNL